MRGGSAGGSDPVRGLRGDNAVVQGLRKVFAVKNRVRGIQRLYGSTVVLEGGHPADSNHRSGTPTPKP